MPGENFPGDRIVSLVDELEGLIEEAKTPFGKNAQMKVIDADDPEKVYGTLTQVSETGANDIYHILFADGKTRYIPAIPQVVISTDVENKVMTIRPLEGLFEI